MAMRVGRGISRRARVIVIAAIAITGIYFFAFAPVRTYIDQRQEIARAQAQHEILSSTNERLRERAEQLGDDAEIRRLASEQYELVMPGQQAYTVMPPPASAENEADQPEDDDGFWSRVRNAVPLL